MLCYVNNDPIHNIYIMIISIVKKNIWQPSLKESSSFGDDDDDDEWDLEAGVNADRNDDIIETLEEFSIAI